MTTRLAWMRGRTGVARHAERAALFRTAQNAADQNSAGRYPLISSPMQISTRVGVLQAIGRPFSAFLNEHVKSARAGAQPLATTREEAQTPLTQQRNSLAGRPVGLPGTNRAAYHCAGKAHLMPGGSASSLSQCI